MPYGEILSTAAKLTWKFKILWLFGLLASCSTGTVNFNNNIYMGDLFDFRGMATGADVSRLLGISQQLLEFLKEYWGLLVVAVFVMSVATFLINVFGRTGVMLGAWVGDSGAQYLETGQLTGATQRAFWPVVGVALLAGLPGVAVALIFMLVAFVSIIGSASEVLPVMGSFFACLTVPLVCGMLPLMFALGIWSELAMAAVIGENGGTLVGLKRAWGLFKRHLGPLLLMGLLVLVLQLVGGALAGAVLAPLTTGVLLGGLNLLMGESMQWSGAGPALLVGLVSWPFVVAAGAIFNAFLSALWVVVFRRLVAAEIYGVRPAWAPPVPPAYPGPGAY